MDGRNTKQEGICWSRALYGDPQIVRGGEGKNERGDGGGERSASEKGGLEGQKQNVCACSVRLSSRPRTPAFLPLAQLPPTQCSWLDFRSDQYGFALSALLRPHTVFHEHGAVPAARQRAAIHPHTRLRQRSRNHIAGSSQRGPAGDPMGSS